MAAATAFTSRHASTASGSPGGCRSPRLAGARPLKRCAPKSPGARAHAWRRWTAEDSAIRSAAMQRSIGVSQSPGLRTRWVS